MKLGKMYLRLHKSTSLKQERIRIRKGCWVRLLISLVLFPLLIRPAQGEDEETVHDLKMEVQTLKGRCDEHEKKIDDLESRCDTHERVIEMLRQEIVGLKDSQNTLSTAYHGERYDMIP